MNPRLHLVSVDSLVHHLDQSRLRHPNLHVDGFSALIQPLDVLVDVHEDTVVQTDAFPYPVAQHEAAVEHGNLRVFAGYQRERVRHAVAHADQHGVVTGVRGVGVRPGVRRRQGL